MSTAAMPAARSGSRAKIVFFLVFGALTVFVTYMKNARIFDPTSEIAQHFAPVKGYLAAHAFFGALAMVLGVFQFSNRLRARYLKIHRTFGYIYIVSVFLAGPFGIPVALNLPSPSLIAASVAQSLGWMVTSAIALYCIKQGNIAEHRRWMIRSYPFAMVFTVARLLIPIPPILKMGLPGVELVVWSTIAAAAFFPSVFVDWHAIKAGPEARTAGQGS